MGWPSSAPFCGRPIRPPQPPNLHGPSRGDARSSMAEWRRAPRLVLIADRRHAARPLTELVDKTVAGGVDAVLLREHHLPRSELHDLAARLGEIIADRAALLVD